MKLEIERGREHSLSCVCGAWRFITVLQETELQATRNPIKIQTITGILYIYRNAVGLPRQYEKLNASVVKKKKFNKLNRISLLVPYCSDTSHRQENLAV